MQVGQMFKILVVAGCAIGMASGFFFPKKKVLFKHGPPPPPPPPPPYGYQRPSAYYPRQAPYYQHAAVPVPYPQQPAYQEPHPGYPPAAMVPPTDQQPAQAPLPPPPPPSLPPPPPPSLPPPSPPSMPPPPPPSLPPTTTPPPPPPAVSFSVSQSTAAQQQASLPSSPSPVSAVPVPVPVDTIMMVPESLPVPVMVRVAMASLPQDVAADPPKVACSGNGNAAGGVQGLPAFEPAVFEVDHSVQTPFSAPSRSSEEQGGPVHNAVQDMVEIVPALGYQSGSSTDYFEMIKSEGRYIALEPEVVSVDTTEDAAPVAVEPAGVEPAELGALRVGGTSDFAPDADADIAANVVVPDDGWYSFGEPVPAGNVQDDLDYGYGYFPEPQAPEAPQVQQEDARRKKDTASSGVARSRPARQQTRVEIHPLVGYSRVARQ